MKNLKEQFLGRLNTAAEKIGREQPLSDAELEALRILGKHAPRGPLALDKSARAWRFSRNWIAAGAAALLLLSGVLLVVLILNEAVVRERHSTLRGDPNSVPQASNGGNADDSAQPAQVSEQSRAREAVVSRPTSPQPREVPQPDHESSNVGELEVIGQEAAANTHDSELTITLIKQAINSPDSLVRHNTWKKLNPEKSQHYKAVLHILKTRNWFERQGAVDALARAGANEKTLEKVTMALKNDRDPFVRQGMADALARMNDNRVSAHLYEALDDKHPFVRRVIAYNLRVYGNRESVEALVQRFLVEKDPVVKAFIERSLNELTQAYEGPDPIAWFSWWEQAKADPNYELGRTNEEALWEAEQLGLKLRERKILTTDVTLTSLERGAGEGVPILILPFYGYSRNIMLPFLSELERRHKLFYIDLPTIDSFKGKLEYAGQTRIPYYPIDLLVEAFEKLRQDIGQERFAIMACGISSWIAMRYAAKFPRSLSHMILVSPLSSQEAYGEATHRLINIGKSKNDIEMWHFGLARQFDSKTGESAHERHHRQKNIPKPEGEETSIDRRRWSLMFKNEQDSMIGALYAEKSNPLGSVAIPKFRAFAEAKLRIPTIVFVGKASLYTDADDCLRIAKHFGGICRVFSDSSCMVFAEESMRFNKEVETFLKKSGRKKRTKSR